MIYILSLIWVFPMVLLAQQEFSIKGKVTAPSGNTLTFINIVLDSENKYPISDEKGNYVIDGVEKGSYTFKVSSIGYKTIEKAILVNRNLVLNFRLEESLELLDEVLVKCKKSLGPSSLKKELGL